MKAIVNIKKSNQYSNLNGLTFDVNMLYNNSVDLDVMKEEFGKRISISFSFKEIIIVDIQKELQKAYDAYNWGTKDNDYHKLITYVNNKKIKYEQLEYNCPA